MTEKSRAMLVPELKVDDLDASLHFWCDLLGFTIRYGRPEEGFAYLDRDGAQVMLDQRSLGPPERRGLWETGPMERPFGRGINLEIQVSNLNEVLAGLERAGAAIYFGPEERWYRVGLSQVGVLQFLVQDPNGYLVRLQQQIGERPIPSEP